MSGLTRSISNLFLIMCDQLAKMFAPEWALRHSHLSTDSYSH
jgi:hypothetical protein